MHKIYAQGKDAVGGGDLGGCGWLGDWVAYTVCRSHCLLNALRLRLRRLLHMPLSSAPFPSPTYLQIPSTRFAISASRSTLCLCWPIKNAAIEMHRIKCIIK